MKSKSDSNNTAGAVAPAAPCSLSFIDAEWLYETLRPNMSYRLQGDKKFWPGEAKKLQEAMERKFSEANS